MKTLKTTAPIACAFLLACGATWAGNFTNIMPTEYFDGLNAKLINSGYRDVRVINTDTHHLVAFDRDGSEVLLVAHPTNYRILSTTYVHPHDN